MTPISAQNASATDLACASDGGLFELSSSLLSGGQSLGSLPTALNAMQFDMHRAVRVAYSAEPQTLCVYPRFETANSFNAFRRALFLEQVEGSEAVFRSYDYGDCSAAPDYDVQEVMSMLAVTGARASSISLPPSCTSTDYLGLVARLLGLHGLVELRELRGDAELQPPANFERLVHYENLQQNDLYNLFPQEGEYYLWLQLASQQPLDASDFSVLQYALSAYLGEAADGAGYHCFFAAGFPEAANFHVIRGPAPAAPVAITRQRVAQTLLKVLSVLQPAAADTLVAQGFDFLQMQMRVAPAEASASSGLLLPVRDARVAAILRGLDDALVLMRAAERAVMPAGELDEFVERVFGVEGSIGNHLPPRPGDNAEFVINVNEFLGALRAVFNQERALAAADHLYDFADADGNAELDRGDARLLTWLTYERRAHLACALLAQLGQDVRPHAGGIRSSAGRPVLVCSVHATVQSTCGIATWITRSRAERPCRATPMRFHILQRVGACACLYAACGDLVLQQLRGLTVQDTAWDLMTQEQQDELLGRMAGDVTAVEIYDRMVTAPNCVTDIDIFQTVRRILTGYSAVPTLMRLTGINVRQQLCHIPGALAEDRAVKALYLAIRPTALPQFLGGFIPYYGGLCQRNQRAAHFKWDGTTEGWSYAQWQTGCNFIALCAMGGVQPEVYLTHQCYSNCGLSTMRVDDGDLAAGMPLRMNTGAGQLVLVESKLAYRCCPAAMTLRVDLLRCVPAIQYRDTGILSLIELAPRQCSPIADYTLPRTVFNGAGSKGIYGNLVRDIHPIVFTSHTVARPSAGLSLLSLGLDQLVARLPGAEQRVENAGPAVDLDIRDGRPQLSTHQDAAGRAQAIADPGPTDFPAAL